MQAIFRNVYVRPLGGMSMPSPIKNQIQVNFKTFQEITPETVLLASTVGFVNLIGLILIKNDGKPYEKEIFMTGDQLLDFFNKVKNTPKSQTITIN